MQEMTGREGEASTERNDKSQIDEVKYKKGEEAGRENR